MHQSWARTPSVDTDGVRAHDSCIEMQTLVQPLRCVHAKINRQTDGHMRAVLASVVKQYLLKRYSHFFLSSELHFYDWGGSKFFHVACSPATVLPGKNPLWGEKRLYKNKYSRLSPGKIGYIVIFPGGGGGSAISPFFPVGNLTMEKTIVFSSGGRRGRGGLLRGKNSSLTGTLPCSFHYFPNGNNYCDFPFIPLSEMGSILERKTWKKKPHRSKLILLRTDSLKRETKMTVFTHPAGREVGGRRNQGKWFCWTDESIRFMSYPTCRSM